MENMHSLEKHLKRLHSLCRLCGGRSVSTKSRWKKSPSLCKTYENSIMCYYRMSISDDIHEQHSKTLCSTCCTRIRSLRKCDRDGSNKEAWIKKANSLLEDSGQLWKGYHPTDSSNECASCSHYINQSKLHDSNKQRIQDEERSPLL